MQNLFHTSVTDRIPRPLGPNPCSIFIDKSAFLSCFNHFKEQPITFKHVCFTLAYATRLRELRSEGERGTQRLYLELRVRNSDGSESGWNGCGRASHLLTRNPAGSTAIGRRGKDAMSTEMSFIDKWPWENRIRAWSECDGQFKWEGKKGKKRIKEQFAWFWLFAFVP